MSILSIVSGKVYVGENGFKRTNLHIEDGQIESMDLQIPNHTIIQLEANDKVLPGRIDGHIHGTHGFDVMDARIEALEGIASALPSEGTTSFLPTTMTAADLDLEKALCTLQEYIASHNTRGKAEVIGIHLEGPFISPDKIGAQNPNYVQKPDLARFSHWNERAGNQIKVVTVAPEIEGALPFIEAITKRNVVASIGHSNGTYEEVQKGLAAGASQFTHLYNGMRGMHHREPGVVGAAFLCRDILTEIITDGLHSAPEMVHFAYELKGRENLLMITDSMRAKCLNDGVYELGGQNVRVNGDKATLEDGTLAGSVLTMQSAFMNMKTFTGANLEDLIHMTSINPAKQYGVYDRKGSIDIGKDADLIILDENDDLKMTICRGQIAYSKR
ncbi:N-acetylglucosamine-6-phosphate deacetylase [Pseudalkalibacillus sp. SCS-8]|uniref:N-acetylglucosamine-6-phosphate deacetylase n=1 Tax=Pseudalkalibacillus nanhaiensis TaxID=3115291 RepID=UPI0032D9F5BD